MKKLAPLCSILLLLLITPLVSAQTSLEIDRGMMTFTGSASSPVGQFTFAGPGLTTLSGGLVDGLFSPNCAPCMSGQQILIRSGFNGEQSIRPGYFTTGNEARYVYYAGVLTADSAPVTLPRRYSRVPFRIIVPITLQGNIQVHGSNPFINPSDLLFQIPVNLQGRAILTLRAQTIDELGRVYYRFLGMTYEFPAPGQTEAK